MPSQKNSVTEHNECMKCRNVKAVLRYHKPKKRKKPELYFHHLPLLQYPWRDENRLIASDRTYASNFYESDVQAVEHNSAIFEQGRASRARSLQGLYILGQIESKYIKTNPKGLEE